MKTYMANVVSLSDRLLHYLPNHLLIHPRSYLHTYLHTYRSIIFLDITPSFDPHNAQTNELWNERMNELWNARMFRVQAWAASKACAVEYVLKGNNALTEHYSAMRADVARADGESGCMCYFGG